MSESEPQMSGSQPAKETQATTETQPGKDELALEQPKEALEMKKMDKEAEQAPSDDGPSIPAPATDDAAISGAKEESSTASVKGKEKDESRAPADKQKDEDALSIGPTDAPLGETKSASDLPVCNITLLLATGKRHPYKIDEKYLAKRNVDIPDITESGKKDPLSISVYKLKELILREWREDWEDKPTSPSSIRLIFFGHQLEDKEQLKKYRFTTESPNIVHMALKPAEVLEEEEAAKGKSSGRDSRNREGGGGCCVIL